MTPNKKLKNGINICYRSERKAIEMKRGIFIVSAILLILAGTFSACKEKEEDAQKLYSAKEGKFEINETEFVKIYFSPESGFIISPVELIFENQSEAVLTYGYEFSLEYFDKENWIEFPLNLNFPDIELGLSAGEIQREQFNLLLIEEYNSGKKGKYRYVKKFGLSYDFPFGIDSCLTLYAEFEIK